MTDYTRNFDIQSPNGKSVWFDCGEKILILSTDRALAMHLPEGAARVIEDENELRRLLRTHVDDEGEGSQLRRARIWLDSWDWSPSKDQDIATVIANLNKEIFAYSLDDERNAPRLSRHGKPASHA